MTPPQNPLVAIDELLEVLRYARERPEMYFATPEDPQQAISFMHGLRVGMQIWGLIWNSDFRRSPLQTRGLPDKATDNEEDLAAQGHSPTEVVHELLSIEIEMWEAHRNALASATGSSA